MENQLNQPGNKMAEGRHRIVRGHGSALYLAA
jgi:hypothetical protein